MTDLHGDSDQLFEPVRHKLREYVDAEPGFSAQLAIHHRGRLVVDLAVGSALSRESLTGVSR
ncbi:hypothetical protein [Microbacterium invictum]|uniref:Uncharacterized protein n=1 Tax=Microbacterium invictum TaxID=515415 RepID=A0AA40SRV0_9MICO|nr:MULTISPECIES: hypothetical protein [Microbacterium]MBB4141253.1 hypothetical protein [Microbacterium invictum]